MRKNPKCPITKPQDFTAPCGCNVSFDNDGLIRLNWCSSHSIADKAVKEHAALVSVMVHAKRYRAAEIAFNKAATLANKQEVSNYGHDFDMSISNLAAVRKGMA